MKAKVLSAVFLLLFIPTFLWAHIPSTHFIFNRVTDNSGRGAYKIVQDVHLVTSDGTIRLREEWSVKDGNELRLTVTGLDEATKGTKIERIYVGSIRHLKSEDRVVNESLQQPMVESFFHSRNTSHLMRLATSIGAIPSEAQNRPPKAERVEDLVLKTNPYARLARTGGSISYAFGRPASGTQLPAGLWIEQDQFLIQRIRYPDGAEVHARDYSRYSRNLSFPKERAYTWSGFRAEARTINVTPINNTDVNMKTAALTSQDELPNDSEAARVIRSFYSRFR